MTEPKHTPGPWHVAFRGDGVASVDHWLIAGLLSAPDAEIRLANARLIAAAPDLFAAAQRAALLIEEAIGVSPELKALLDAIAKAEGNA